MKATEVQQLLSLYGSTSAKRAEAIATALRASGLLPRGGRGFHAPDLTAEQIVMFMLAGASPRRLEDAAADAALLAGLVNEKGESLLSTLERQIAFRDACLPIHWLRLMVGVPVPKAELLRQGADGPEYFMQSDFWKDDWPAASQGAGFVGPIGHIGGGVIDQAAVDFSQELEGEWIG